MSKIVVYIIMGKTVLRMNFGWFKYNLLGIDKWPVKLYL